MVGTRRSFLPNADPINSHDPHKSERPTHFVVHYLRLPLGPKNFRVNHLEGPEQYCSPYFQ